MLAQTCQLVVNTDWSVKSLLCFQNKHALSVDRIISLFDIKQKNIYDSAVYFTKIAPNMQVESSATPLLTIDEVKKIYRWCFTQRYTIN